MLIERYGDDALAVRFLRPRASEDLSTVIQAAMDGADPDQPPSLASVRDAMLGGLVAQLVGHGQLDSDDEQTLFEEVDALVDKHGEDALAEASRVNTKKKVVHGSISYKDKRANILL